MMDWGALLRNAPWVLGLAIILADLSLASYRARQARARPGTHPQPAPRPLARPGSRALLWLGLLLVSTSLVLTARAPWQRLVYGLIAAFWLASLVQMGLVGLRKR